jgi:hypothetical protein
MSFSTRLLSIYILVFLYGILSLSADPASSKQLFTSELFSKPHDEKGFPQSSAIESIFIGDPDGKMLHPLLGVNAGPSPAGRDPRNPDLTLSYRKIGVTMVRNHDFYGPLDMAVMYPNRLNDPLDMRSYDFRGSDLIWKSIFDGGFEPYFRLGDSWNNSRPPANDKELANWVKASLEVIRHYHQGKWNGFNTQFRYVEIWNEPDNDKFWPKPRSPREYYDLYVETAKAIKHAFPELKVGGPGITQAAFDTPRGKRWMNEFLIYVKKNNAPLDFFSWHIYSNDPNKYLEACNYYRQSLDDLGFQNVPMHVTEYNTDHRFLENNRDELLALRTGGKGAAITTSGWIAMQKAGVEAATFYRGNDPSMDEVAFYGMFYANGKPKRIALAFSLWSEIVKYPQSRTVNNSQNNKLWVLAGQNQEGKVAVLVSNPTETPIRYAIKGIQGSKYVIKQVNDSSEKVNVIVHSGSEIEIGAYTVQLITTD